MVGLKKPWLLLSAQTAHDLAPYAVRVLAKVLPSQNFNFEPLNWKGLDFRNRVGLAGGADKNATQIKAWWNLGVGFIEVGTVTPHPQKANPGRVVARDVRLGAVWNKLGFPSLGWEYVFRQLVAIKEKRDTPIFINIGKNRSTPNENAAADYLFLIEKFAPVADAFVVNVSSPNTAGLRELLKEESLKPLLSAVRSATAKPVLVKLSPDMTSEELRKALEVAHQTCMDGAILTNTTRERSPQMFFEQEGGVSGAPLKEKSFSMLRAALEILGERKKDFLIVSVGGVSDAAEVRRRLSAGADLVQAYSALIFEGPLFFRRLIRELRQ